MMNYKPKQGDMELWLITAASDVDKLKQMKRNEDGSYPVVFSVGGVELDFSKVAKRIDSQITKLVTSKAQTLLDEHYGNLIKDINDIQERIENQKERFKYEWEE